MKKEVQILILRLQYNRNPFSIQERILRRRFLLGFGRYLCALFPVYDIKYSVTYGKFRKDLFMENYQMNRSGRCSCSHSCTQGSRSMMRTPAQPTCSAPMPCPENRSGNHSGGNRCGDSGCSCHMPGCPSPHAEMFSHLSHLPAAMGYVPCQKFDGMFDLGYALQVGTIFPQLCKPFCGRRGGCR